MRNNVAFDTIRNKKRLREKQCHCTITLCEVYALFERKESAMNATTKKYILLALMLATALLLSGCYMDGQDTTTGGSNIAGNNGLPFENVVTPTPSPSPSPTPTSVPADGSTIGNVDWDEGGAWNETLQTAPSTTNATGVIVTMPPNVNTSGTTSTATPAPTRTASTSGGTGDSTSGVLKAGADGTEVKEVQQRLKDLKYYTGSVDGKYGAGTTNAVKDFQEANGLKADGVVGEKTKEALFSYYAVAKSASSSSSSSGGSSTPKPTAKATATPKPTATPKTDKYLRVGSSGSDVKQLQTRLIELGYLTGKADGDFGTGTETAVKSFQKRNSVYDDGIAGPDTLTKLYSSSAKKANGSVASVGTGTLEVGSEGDAVRALQNRLIKLKYLSGYSDGSYGDKTKAAVEAFQKNNGLNVDGKAGATTLAKLYADDAVDAKGNGGSSTSSGSSTGSSTGYTVLQDGDKGEAVKKLQQRLKELGYYTGSVDGSYGSGTLSAVRAFQSAMQLNVDGKAGPATQRALYGENAKAEDTSKPLELGSEGNAVTNLQYALYELGYYQAKINGVYTQDTSNAVREFQMNNGLSVDGKAGSQTLAKVYSPYAKPAAAETPTYVTVQKGSSGEDVVQVQGALYDLGYSTRRATGEFDQDTYDALVAFQKKNGLNADGIAGAETQQKLFSAGAVRAN